MRSVAWLEGAITVIRTLSQSGLIEAGGVGDTGIDARPRMRAFPSHNDPVCSSGFVFEGRRGQKDRS